MKRFFTILFVLIAASYTANTVNAEGINVISSSSRSLNISVSIPPNISFKERPFKDGNNYHIFHIKGAGEIDSPGKPNLPVFGKWILVPNGTSVNITVNKGNPIVFNNINLAPVQYPKPDITDEKERPFVKDEVVYSSDKDFPGIFSEVEPVSKKRGQSITILWVYPYQYNPVTKTLTVYPDLNVNVTFTGAIQPIPSNLINDNLIKSLKGTAINAEEVLSAEQLVKNISQENKSPKDDGCEMLIITYSGFSSAAERLAAWKRRRGIITKVVATSTTGTSSSQIETYINNAYNNWTPAPSYVLFFGDANYVHTIYRNWHPDHGYPYYQGQTASDIWYADVDESSGTIPVADMAYGRIPVSSLTRADSIVNRIIRYERTPPTNSSFYSHTTNAGAFQDKDYNDYADRRFAKTSEDVRNYLNSHGYVTQRIYTTIANAPAAVDPTYWNNGDYVFENDGGGGLELPSYLQKPTFPWDGSTSDISSAINAGRFFLMHRDHGSRSGWAHPGFYESNVDALSNGELRPIVFSINCETGWFDNETDDTECNTGYTDECFVESWINHATGGSCGLIAPTRISYSGNNDRLIWGWMDAIWSGFLHGYDGVSPINSPEYRMGDVLTYGLSYMMSHYTWSGDYRRTSLEEYNYFGDPTMEIWTSAPSSLSNAYTTTNINIGTTYVTVQVEPHIAGMLVTVCTETADDVFGTAYTNSSGIATVALNNAISVQPMVYVTITKHNYRPYEFVAGRNTWTGAINSNWNNTGNWSAGVIPNASNDVIIPGGTPHQPTIGTGTSVEYAYCKDLTIQSGAVLSQTGTYLNRSFFHVYGDFNSDAGTFSQLSDYVFLYFDGSTSASWDDDGEDDTYTMVRVQKTGTNYLYMWQNMTVKSFEIREGNFKIDAQWTLTVTGTSNYAFQVEDGGILNLQDETIDVTSGDVEFEDGSQVNVTGGLIRCGADFRVDPNISYDIQFTGGTVEMYGSLSQLIEVNDENTQFYNLTINKGSGTCYINYNDLDVRNNITINSGILDPNGYRIFIGGNWINYVGDAAFLETGSRVVFNGSVSGHQYCTSEHFDTLEVAKAAGGAFRPFGGAAYNIVCEHYDWTAGAVDVIPGGSTFTANDLIDNGIYGAFYLNPGGTINLTNSDGYVDLDGELHILGGTMNVYGGTSDSYWPWIADASITMSDGVLDFHDQGIYIYNSSTYTLTENITGGTIRTSQGFSGNRADFTPSAGTFEFYGSSDYYISQSNGCTLYDVNIDKSTKNSNATATGQPVIDERSKEVLSPGSKSNTILLGSDFVVTNDLTVTSGELKLNGHSLTIGNDCDVYGTLTMDNAADILNFGVNYSDQLNFWSGSTANLSNGVAHIYGWVIPRAGCSFTATTNHTTIYNGVTGGGPSNFEPTAVYGNIIIDKIANEITFIDNSATEPIVVNGSFTVNPDNKFEMQNETLIVHGTFTDASSSEIYVYDAKKSAVPEMKSTGKIAKGNPKAKGGYLELDNDFTLNGLLDVGDGDVLAHGNFGTASTASINIDGGTFICDAPDYDKGWEFFNGNLSMTSGLFEFTFNSFNFTSTATTTISGGTLRTGGAFYANIAGTFQPTGGIVEVIGNINDNAIYCDNGNYFYDLIINRDPGVFASFITPVTIKNDLTINSGALNSYYNDTIYLGGNWINNVGTAGFVEGTGTVVFNSSGDATITPGETFYNLTLDKSSGGDWLTLTDDVTVLNDLNVNGGALHTAANILDVNGDVTIDGGTLFVQAGGTLKVGDNKNLTTAAGSNFYIEGSSSAQATLTHSGTGRYGCNIYGEIAANYATFEYMGQNGITLYPGATVNPTYTFNHCIFINGAPAKGSAYLVLNSSNTFTADDVYFENTTGDIGYNVWKALDAGNATFENYSGDFAGPEFEYDPYDRIQWGPVDVDMALTVMLEGPYNGIDMNTDLNTLGLIPLSQPFNSNSSADWYYTGTESVASIPANVVDWVLVQIRDASDAASADASTVVAEQAAFLLNDGSIVDLDGLSNLYFPGISYSSGLYPVVWHRNHLGVISADRMTRSGGVYSYDFTAAGSAYSNSNAGETDLGGGVYGLWGGDSNGTGWVYDGDIYYLWKPYAGEKGYRDADFDLNGQLDNKDKNDVWFDSYNKYSQIPGSKNNYSDDTK